jgi:hypothetical protein
METEEGVPGGRHARRQSLRQDRHPNPSHNRLSQFKLQAKNQQQRLVLL